MLQTWIEENCKVCRDEAFIRSVTETRVDNSLANEGSRDEMEETEELEIEMQPCTEISATLEPLTVKSRLQSMNKNRHLYNRAARVNNLHRNGNVLQQYLELLPTVHDVHSRSNFAKPLKIDTSKPRKPTNKMKKRSDVVIQICRPPPGQPVNESNFVVARKASTKNYNKNIKSAVVSIETRQANAEQDFYRRHQQGYISSSTANDLVSQDHGSGVSNIGPDIGGRSFMTELHLTRFSRFPTQRSKKESP